MGQLDPQMLPPVQVIILDFTHQYGIMKAAQGTLPAMHHVLYWFAPSCVASSHSHSCKGNCIEPAQAQEPKELLC